MTNDPVARSLSQSYPRLIRHVQFQNTKMAKTLSLAFSSGWRNGGTFFSFFLPICQRGNSESQTTVYAHDHTVNLESTVNLTQCMPLGCGRKPEHPERTHTYMGRTSKLHTEKPQTEFKSTTFLQ